MKRLQANDTGKGRIFNSGFLELFTRTGPALTAIYYGSVLAGFIYLNYIFTDTSFTAGTSLYIGAMLFWTLFEYLIHRYVFHFINDTAWAQRFHYMIHGVHHQHPRDEERLFMPPLPGTILIILLFCIFYPVFGLQTFIWMAGFINGWGIYVAIHYIVHVYQPVKPFKILWTHHARHHYKDVKRGFGVSSPLWDYVFGTMPE